MLSMLLNEVPVNPHPPFSLLNLLSILTCVGCDLGSTGVPSGQNEVYDLMYEVISPALKIYASIGGYRKIQSPRQTLINKNYYIN